MVTLSEAVKEIQQLEHGNLGQQIALIEEKLRGANKKICEEYFKTMQITPSLFDSACVLKRLAGQINVIVHAVGIMLSLPYILRDDEVIQGLSLGAGNTGEPFDIETNYRIAEFKFIHWKGGPESIRKNQLFKDFYLLAEYDTTKERFLYVVDDRQPLKFFNSGRSLSSVMSRNNKLWNEFQNLYQRRFITVQDYFNFRKSQVIITDLRIIVPEFSNGFELVDESSK